MIDERKRNRNPRNPVIETVRGLLPLLPIPRVRAVARSLINVVRLPIRRIIFASGSGRNRKAGLETVEIGRNSIPSPTLYSIRPEEQRSDTRPTRTRTHGSRPLLPSPHSPRANFLPLPAPLPPPLVVELCFSYFSPHAKPGEERRTNRFARSSFAEKKFHEISNILLSLRFDRSIQGTNERIFLIIVRKIGSKS